MSKTTYMQHSFTGGEFSPRVFGRTDLEKYATGAARLENFLTLPHGGITRRPGTRFVAECKFAGMPTRLIPFEFSEDQTYILEMGHGYIRFFTDEGQVLDDLGNPYEIVTPFEAEDLAAFSYAQSADVMYLCHRSYPPHKLARLDHTDWTLEMVVFTDGPYMDENTDTGVTVTPSATGELIINGGFDSSLDDWDDLSAGDSVIEWDASGWANLISDGKNRAGMAQTLELQGGTSYTLSFEVKAGPLTLRVAEPELCTGGTATASSVQDADHNADKAFDGDMKKAWTPSGYASPGAEWIQYAFGSTKNVKEIHVYNGDPADLEKYFVTAYKVQKSDGSGGWTDIQEFTDLDQGWVVLTLDTAEDIDTVRLVPNSAVASGSKPYVTEVEVFTSTAVILPPTACGSGVHEKEIVIPGAVAMDVEIKFYHTSDAARAVDSVSIPRIGTACTLTASEDLFEEGHLGAFWRVRHNESVGYVRILEVVSATSAQAEILAPLGATDFTSTWREGAWCDANGYPAAVIFHEGRLWFGGSTAQPQHLWGSASSDYENFTPGAEDADPITAELASGQINLIRWMRSGRVLMVGTIGGEWRLGSVDTDSPLTPAATRARQETTYGSAAVVPVQVGGVVLFVQRAARKLREMAYDYQNNGWTAPDMTILAEHVTAGGIMDMAYAQEPDSIVWIVRGDGVLLGFTYNRAEQVIGWHRHPMAGEVKTVTAVARPDHDQVWLLVERERAV